jgi:hypothetical protein
MDQINFQAAAGDYVFRFLLRTTSGIQQLVHVSIHLESRGSFTLAFAIMENLFSYCRQSNEEQNPVSSLSPGIAAVDELLLVSGPLHPDSDFVDISGYSYMSVTPLPIEPE